MTTTRSYRKSPWISSNEATAMHPRMEVLFQGTLWTSLWWVTSLVSWYSSGNLVNLVDPEYTWAPVKILYISVITIVMVIIAFGEAIKCFVPLSLLEWATALQCFVLISSRSDRDPYINISYPNIEHITWCNSSNHQIKHTTFWGGLPQINPSSIR